jgi:signal peptidase II
VHWLGLSAFIVAADQLTKYWITQTLGDGEIIKVTSFFNLVLARNTGAAFSLLADAGGWQRHFFTFIAVAAAVIIVYLLARSRGNKLFDLALALLLGGALGNLWDRVRLGHVTDFLDFHVLGYHWPAFNVADSAISLGVVLLLWDALRKPKTA